MTKKTAPAKEQKPVTEQAPNLGGRPRFEIDYDKLQTLCGMQCTGDECAAVLGCHYETLNRRLHEDYREWVEQYPVDPPEQLADGFIEYFKRFSASGRASLRQAQFKAALKGSAPMLKWLGVNLLGQTDRVDHVSHDGSMSPAGLDHFYGSPPPAAPGADESR